jgi:hypothetical protein
MSDVSQGERAWPAAINIGEAVLCCQGSCHQDRTASARHLRIAGQRGYRAADELRALRITQIKHARGQHRLRADQSGIERNHVHTMGPQLVCHVRRHPVSRDNADRGPVDRRRLVAAILHG